MSVEILLRNGFSIFPKESSKVVEDRIKSAVKGKAWGIELDNIYGERVMVSLDAIDFVRLEPKED